MNYKELHTMIKGETLPMASENSRGNAIIVTAGRTEDDMKFITLKTCQDNGWIRVNTYYEDGTFEETYEK